MFNQKQLLELAEYVRNHGNVLETEKLQALCGGGLSDEKECAGLRDFLKKKNILFVEENEDCKDVETKEKPETEEGRETYSQDDSVKAYLKEIGKIPLLTPEEELSLAIRMKEGDEEEASLTDFISDDRMPEQYHSRSRECTGRN